MCINWGVYGYRLGGVWLAVAINNTVLIAFGAKTTIRDLIFLLPFLMPYLYPKYHIFKNLIDYITKATF